MNARRIIAFKHTSALGNAPSHALFSRVKIKRRLRNEVVPLSDPLLEEQPPRAYEDYDVMVDRHGLPSGVEIIDTML
jgi:CRISPR-associated protein Csd2